jgi:immunity protein, SdpI family
MKNLSDRFYWLIALGLIVAAFVASLALYGALPERIPIHWGIDGKPDRFGDKTWAIFLSPMIMIGMLALFAVLPFLSPRPFDLEKSRSTYLFVVVVVMGFLAFVHGLTLLATLRPSTQIPRLIVAGTCLFFMILGNVMGKMRPNLYMGIRTPWTLASERVWTDTHRLGAWMFVAGGLIGFVTSLLGWIIITIALITVAAFVPVGYSWYRYKQLERAGALKELDTTE